MRSVQSPPSRRLMRGGTHVLRIALLHQRFGASLLIKVTDLKLLPQASGLRQSSRGLCVDVSGVCHRHRSNDFRCEECSRSNAITLVVTQN